MDDSNYVQSTLPLINKDPNLLQKQMDSFNDNEKLNRRTEQSDSNIVELLDKLIPVMPNNQPTTSTNASNSDATNQETAQNSSVLSSVFEQFQKFHETLLTEKLDNFKTQKGELEELKEKIMKLEQRNFELEKKLSSNVTPSANLSSKENSFNESFSLQTDESFNKQTNNNNTTNQLQTEQSVFQASTPSNLMFQNKLNLMPQQQQQQSNQLQNTLNTIPNINQGGFIITSNGSIAYVPPMPLQQQQSTNSKPSSSTNPSSSGQESAVSPYKTNQTDSNNLFDDYDTSNKNSANLDLNSILNKNLFNQFNPKSNQTSPNQSNVNKTSPSKTNQQQQQAFILSNGQLVPVITSSTAPNLVTNSAISPSLLLPTSNVVAIQPKPQSSCVSSTSTPLLAPKKTKPKPKITKPKQLKSNETIQIDLTTKPVVPVLTSPVPTASTSPTNTASLKHRAIRPKPSSNSATVFINNNNNQGNKLIVMPANQQQQSAAKFGIIKINTLSSNHSQQISSPKTVTSFDLNSTQSTGVVMETNDILSKAASMIFSPSEFTLNNLSPNTNQVTNQTNLISPNTALSNVIVNFNQQNDSQFLLSTISATNNNTVAIQPKANKIAIQRNPKQPNIQPLMPKPDSTSQISTTNKQPKIKITQNSQPKSVKPKIAKTNEPQLNKQNKIALPPLKSKPLDSKPSVEPTEPIILNQNSLNLKNLLFTNDKPSEQPETIESFNKPTNNIDLVLKQQEQFDIQIQLQLQSLFSNNPVVFQNNFNINQNETEKKETENKKHDLTNKKDRSNSPDLMSMPSLEQFFEIEANESLKSNKSNKSVTKKSLDLKKTETKKSPVNKKAITDTKPTKSKQKEELSPKTNKTSNIQIKPKELKSKPKEPVPEKIKFELVDLDKVLQQVESIPNEPETNTKTDKNRDFLFDLLNDNESNNSDFKLNTFTTNCEDKTKIENKKLKLNDKSVLSTPPSLINTNKTKKKKNIQQEQKTPIKTTQIDDDIFSFLDQDDQRTPLKPDNLNTVKKRGRPPKTGLTNDTKSSKLSTKNTRINFDLQSNENSELDESIADETKKTQKKTLSDDENSNILNAAVANTFQELIDKNNLDSISKDQPYPNDEVEDFNDFVYDLADPDQNGSESQFDLNRLESDNPNHQEITIASLAMPKRKREKIIKKIKKDKSKKKKRRRSASLSDDESNSNSDNTDDEKSNKSDENIDKIYDDEKSKISIESIIENKEEQIATIAQLAGTTDKQRKRGRPPKQELTKTNETNEIGEFFTSKNKNYKKISNPGGTTSLLALNPSSDKDGYAGLTRFEIPFEINETNPLSETNKDNLIDDSCSKNKIQKIDESFSNKTNNLNPIDTEDKNKTSSKQKENVYSNQTKSKVDNKLKKVEKEQTEDEEEPLIKTDENIMIQQKEDDKDKTELNEPEFNEPNEQPVVTNDKIEEENNLKDDKMLYNDQMSYEATNNKQTDSFWNNYQTNQNGTNNNTNHVSHYDLENDPILNNDLQQLHNEQQMTKSLNNNQLVITPPSTVSSVCSSSGSTSSNTYNNNINNSNTNLSINPSSTSSNSSTQMISPVSSINSISDTINNGLRSSSVDPLQYNNNYFNSQTHLNSNNYQLNTNVSYNNKYPPNYDLNTSQQNLNITQPNRNSSPQLITSNQLYNQANNSNRSHSVAPTPPLVQQATHLLNTSQSPHHRNSSSLSSTPTPTPTTPTPAAQPAYYNQVQTTPPSSVRSDTNKIAKEPINQYNQTFNYQPSYQPSKNGFNFEQNYQSSNQTQAAAVAAVATMFNNTTNSSYSFPNQAPTGSFPINRTDYNAMGFNHLNQNSIQHSQYDSTQSNYLPSNSLNHSFLMNQQTMQHLNSTRFLPNLNLDNNKKQMVKTADVAPVKKSSKPKKTNKPVTTPITPPSNGPIITPITPSTTPTPNQNNYGYNTAAATTNRINESMIHAAAANWYDFSNKNEAAFASLSSFFHKQQAENVSSFGNNYNPANVAHNPAKNWNNPISNVSNNKVSSNTAQISQNQQLEQQNRQFNSQQLIQQTQYNNSQTNQIPQGSNSLNNFFTSTKAPLKQVSSQEDLNSQSRSSYQHQQVNTNNNYMKQPLPRTTSSGNTSDTYQRNVTQTNTHMYQQQYANNQLNSQAQSSSGHFTNNYPNQFNSSHGSIGSNQINQSLPHLNSAPGVAAAAAAFPHHLHPAAAMSSILANQFSNVPQFNPWN